MKNKVIRKKIGKNNTKYYLFGVRIWKRNNPFSTKNLENKIDNLTRSILENKILLLNSYYNSTNTEKLILCVDALHDKYAECIDAYTSFNFLQEKGIPSKYILLENNPLYDELKQKNKLKDIIIVKNQKEFIEKNIQIIAQSKCILTSYGLSQMDNIFLKNLPFLKYIFIEHGVTLLKKWVVRLYNTNSFDKILVPTQATYDFYKSKNLYADSDIIKCGLPRWDKLKREPSETKNIFLFFTRRYSNSKDEFNVYFERIKELISEISNITKKNNNLKTYFAIHHTLLDLAFNIPQYKNVEIILTTNISKMIGKTDLLITDYSSICFDFMYLDTPVIFYRFDEDVNYSDKRDIESFLSAKEEDKNLYNCFYELDEVINKINYYIKNNFELERENKEKNNKIFWQNKNNCETLLTFIKEK